MNENNLISLFRFWNQSEQIQVIHLLNKDRVPVGAIYLNKVDIEKLCVCEIDKTEKYMVFNDGLVIMFTYYTKGNENV